MIADDPLTVGSSAVSALQPASAITATTIAIFVMRGRSATSGPHACPGQVAQL